MFFQTNGIGQKKRATAGNLQLCNEICLADTVNRFIGIGSDACSAADDLFGNHGFMFLFGKVLIELDDPRRKMKGLAQQNGILTHSRESPLDKK